MTTYVTIASSDLDAESPIDTDLMTAIARNPDAYAEDDASCPVFKGRVKAAAISAIDTASIASVAVSSGQTMMVWASGVYYFDGFATTGTGTVTIKIKHNGTTLVQRAHGIDAANENIHFAFSLFAITTTAVTGTLEVTGEISGGGGGDSLTVTIEEENIMYLKFTTP